MTAKKLHIAILNWKQYDITENCLLSLKSAWLPPETTAYLLDNESEPSELQKLIEKLKPLPFPLKALPFTGNLGFAAAYNRFFESILPPAASDDLFLVLNNDTEVTPNFARRMIEQVNPTKDIEMIACEMLLMEDKKTVDNRGVTMYRSGLAHPKSKPWHKLFCPSGGCALYTARLLKTLKEKTGHVFDEHFFCYTEDVDLGYRALLLGFTPALAKDARVYHHLSYSTGGGFNEFIMFHGLRNTLYSTIKNTPLSLLIWSSPYMLLLHMGIIFRYLSQGKFALTFRIYWQTLRALPRLLKQRKRIQNTKRISSRALKAYINPELYDATYLKLSLKTLFSKNFIKRERLQP